MKLKTCTNHDIHIKGKTPDDFQWCDFIKEMVVPSKSLFIITDVPSTFDTIKKINWDFGDNTKIVTVTNRKQPAQDIEIKHIFRVNTKEIQTLTIQASVYTDDTMYITPSFLVQSLKSKDANNYINPTIFRDQIIQYYNDGILTDEVADSVQKIANRLAFATNFINYTYREEMVGDALIKMVEALRSHKYIPTKGNPFSYFTKIAFHAFCNRIKKEKKARTALEELQKDTYERLVADGSLPYQGSNPKAGLDFEEQNSELIESSL